MTPKELYERTPQKISHDLNDIIVGTYGKHFPEIDEIDCGYFFKEITQSEVEIRIYKYFNFDHRRFWNLQSIYFNGTPFIIQRNAGREGDDHCSRIVTNKEVYIDFIKHIKFIIIENNNYDKLEDLVDEDLEINDLLSFYGNSLDGWFESHSRF